MNNKLLNSPFANVFLFSFFWAAQLFFSKIAFNLGAKAIPFTLQSAFVSMLILSIIVLPRKFKEIRTLPKNILIGLIVANAIHFGLGGFFSNAGLALTSAINAGFLSKFALVTTTFLAWILLKEKMNATKLIAVGVMLLGSFFITTKGGLIVPQTGDLLIILACTSWSIGNILVRKVLRNNSVSGDTVSFLRPISGIPVLLFFVFLSPLYPPQIQKIFNVNLWDMSYLPYVCLSGLLTALLWLYLNRTLKVASASYMTMMSMMTPVIVSILALVFLKETLVPIQLLGAFLIVLSGIATHYLKVDKQ